MPAFPSCSRFGIVFVSICITISIPCNELASTGATITPETSSMKPNYPPSAGLTTRLPDRIRKFLLGNAKKTSEWEEMSIVPVRGQHDGLLSLAQRALWTQNFNNARASGVGVMEAQEIALRGAADGRLYAQPTPSAEGTDMVEHFGGTSVDRTYSDKVTCMACHFELADRSEIRVHYTSDWHLFNVERKSAGIRPISQADFGRKIAEAQDMVDREDEDPLLSSQLSTYKGTISVGADYLIRKNSDKRGSRTTKLRAELRAQSASEGNRDIASSAVPSMTPREARKEKAAFKRNAITLCTSVSVEALSALPDLDVERCPFDGFVSISLAENIQHMRQKHACYLPKGDKLKDASGLVQFLLRKGAQGHMESKSHSRLPKDHEVWLEEIFPFCHEPELSSISMSNQTSAGQDDLVGGLSSVSLSHDPLPSPSTACSERVRLFKEAAQQRAAQAAAREAASHEDDISKAVRPTVHSGKPSASVTHARATHSIGGQRGADAEGNAGSVWEGTRPGEDMSRIMRRKRDKLLQKGGKKLEDKRAAMREHAEQMSQTLLRQKQLGTARPGWRESASAEHTVAMESNHPEADPFALLSDYYMTGSSNSTALSTMRRPAGAVASIKDWSKMQRMRVKVMYQNYYTRKASLGKQNKQILNSGYRA